ncbi:MAG: MBL fold metallo-hydrolase [Alphaproteobacteria bacterium]|nr:MBL fold metallo-hydrolase [Alphaproteobacteria bacterium]
MTAKIYPVFCNQKNMANYAYIINPTNTNKAIIIDAAEAKPILTMLETLNLIPTHIITTHHHFDHVEGNLELKEKYNLTILAPNDELEKISGASVPIIANQEFILHDIKFLPISAKGHTNGHLIYYIKELEALFTGDVLFNLCVGGLFEGTAKEMFETLQKIKQLPDSTLIFPGHEYTSSCITRQMLNHKEFKLYLEKLYLRQQNKLAPATLFEEKLFNPYLQANTFDQFLG